MKIKIGCFLLFFLPLAATCQNFLANSSFEDFNTCTEYQAQCSPAAWFIVTRTRVKYPPAKEGEGVMTFLYDNVNNPMVFRSFPYTMTLCPLRAGKEYELSFWLFTGDFPFTHLEVILSKADPTRTPSVIGKIIPTVALTSADIVEKDDIGWMLIRKKFTVDEEKRFFLIGNVLPPDHYPRSLEKKLKARGGGIIFCMDDINLLPTDTAEKLCNSYAYTHSILYEEHHRHSRHIYLDSLPANSVPLQSSHDTLAAQEQPPPLLIPPATDTFLIPGLLFATNSSVINSHYAGLLDSVITHIQNKPPSGMEIDGYTDNTATDEFNLQLSLQRATSIRNYIIKKLPNLEPLTAIRGFGASRPVASNTTPAGKARNRRVEIVLIY